jgi:hypothetical protein
MMLHDDDSVTSYKQLEGGSYISDEEKIWKVPWITETQAWEESLVEFRLLYPTH